MNSNTTLTAAALLICYAATAFGEATLTYALVNDFSGETYAFLELAELPASSDEFISLTFSQLGQSLFGFDRVYSGTFDSVRGEFDDDGTGVLYPVGHLLDWTDEDPPISSVRDWKGFGVYSFPNDTPFSSLQAFSGVGSSLDQRAFGDWILVPEPSAGVLATLTAVGLGLLRRRR